MIYYLLQPCRTTAGFMSTLKRRVKLHLGDAASALEEAGFSVMDVGPLLIVQKDVELTLYATGKMIAKTTDREKADLAVREVYSILLPELGGGA